jgi:hypothetical protein
MVDKIFANAGTIITFKTNSPSDEKQLLPLFTHYLQPGDIANLPAYNFYAKLSGGLIPQEPLSGMTVLTQSGDDSVAEAAVEASRANYAKKYDAPPAQSRARTMATRRRQKKAQSRPNTSEDAKPETTSGLASSERTDKTKK